MVASPPQQGKPPGRSARRTGAERRADRAQRQRRPAAHRARHRPPHRPQAAQPWRRLSRDQQAGAARLTAGQIARVTVAGWGIVGQGPTFLDELGYLGLLEIEGAGYQRGLSPLARRRLPYQVQILLGIGALALVPTRLFRELALLKLIGYTTAQIAAGFWRRGHVAAGPMPKNTLADASERLSAPELTPVLNAPVKRLGQQGFLRASRSPFALDASALATTRRYLGAGMQTITARKVTTQKQSGEIERFVDGFMVLTIDEVRLRRVGAATVVPIKEQASPPTLTLVRQALDTLGPGVLRVLLIDAGFLDGETLGTLKRNLVIECVVPSKATRHGATAAQPLSRPPAAGETIFPAARPGEARPQPDGTVRCDGQGTLVGVTALPRADQSGTTEHAAGANRAAVVATPIPAVVVTAWAGPVFEPGKAPVFLTSLPVRAPLVVLALDDLRSLLENTAFRELKQGWGLGHFPKKTLAAVRGHVRLTRLTFTLTNAVPTQQGQALPRCGIRRQRAEPECGQVISFAGADAARFDIEEVVILLGGAPAPCLRVDPGAVRRRDRLPPRLALPAAA